MANVVNRATREYEHSVNEPDYPLVDWIHNPDLSAVAGFSSKYWVIAGDVVSLMPPADRAVVDAAEVEAEKEGLSTNLDRVIKAFVFALNKGAFIPGSNYTPVQIKAIIKAEL